MSSITKTCEVCGKSHRVKQADLNRGWGKTCSKSCAAKLRERSRADYDPERVARNNDRRANWHSARTSEGYVIRDGVAYDEFGEAVYSVTEPDRHPLDDHEYWDSKDY